MHANKPAAEPGLELFALRFEFSALTSLYFPPGKAGNIFRGTFGSIFRRAACLRDCPGARTCPGRLLCPYARIFEPTAVYAGPSGLSDLPRPFVFRAAHLDGSRAAPGQRFHFDLHLFDTRSPALAYLALSFSELMRGGLGPGNGAAHLMAIRALDGAGQAGATIFDGATLHEPPLLQLPLSVGRESARSVRINFLTPTELKASGAIVRQPEFGALFARVRDRIHTLRELYGAGPLALDFAAMGERASAVKLLHSDVGWKHFERRSGHTGQTHSLGGLTGWAEYEGDFAEFLPYLRAAFWTGVGRQTTWGKGQIETIVLK